MNPNTCIIILAAGSSSRLGQAKQLVEHNGKSLIRMAIEQSLELNADVRLCVLGHSHELISQEISSYDIITLVNKRYSEGMNTSISNGIKYLMQHHPVIEQVLIMLVDQPFIPHLHYQQLLDKAKSGEYKIVATSYDQTIGVPAVFNQTLFDELSQINGEKGAKAIMTNTNQSLLTSIPCKEAAIDIDLPDDLNKLNTKAFEP